MSLDDAPQRSIRIGIFGHYGNGNLGDEAIVEAAIASCRRIGRGRPVEVELFSINPDDSRRRYGLPAHAIRASRRKGRAAEKPVVDNASQSLDAPPSRSLRERLKRVDALVAVVRFARRVVGIPGALVRELRFLRASAEKLDGIDVMIFAGSNQFLDNFGGVWGFPYTLLKWSWLCRKRGTAVMFFSVGAGPLKRAISRLMVRRAIRISAYHSYRDRTSLELIEGSETNLGGVVVADLARNLDCCSPLPQAAVAPVKIGINPMPVYDERYWFHGDKTRYSSYVDKIADLAHRLAETGAQVFFFPTHPSDERVIDDVLAVLRNEQRPTIDSMTRKSPKSVQELMGVIQEADVVIPTRFHGVVLSLVAERLVLGICYQQKSADVLNAAGQQDYHVMLDRLEVSDLMSRFDRLWTSRDEARHLIRQSNERAREELHRQYHYLESFVTASSDARV